MIGIASGLVLVTVPLHLSEIAPERLSRLFGTLHQISIGIGMIIAQCLSIPFEKPFQWRYVQLVGAGIAVALMISSSLMGRADRKGDRGNTEETRLLLDQGRSWDLVRVVF
jgi:MFS family permease